MHHADAHPDRIVGPAMTTKTAAVVSDPSRVPIIAEKRDTGGLVIRRGNRFVALSDSELERLIGFATDRGQLVAHKSEQPAQNP